MLQWYLQIDVAIWTVAMFSFTTAYFLFFLFPFAVKFKLQILQAILLNLILITFGSLLTWQKDTRHNENWFGHQYRTGDYLIVRINEPLVVKAKSYKADGYVEGIIHNDSIVHGDGKILIYFSKDSLAPTLKYGDKIIISKNLQRIKNSGNPGAFNYERYAGFQQIFYNVYLKDNDWVKTNDKNVNWFKQFVFSAREGVLSSLKKNIGNNKDELGIAEALLIGYTNDLDKDLVQAYSNTGVVHIIAISGMHLGLIYLLLVGIFKKIPLLNKSRFAQVLLILGSLWLFSLLTGASASVIRAAVMFTFITVGTNFKKKSSIYNSLAASAFVMLCYNPFFLWDVGFQLSYLAVVSIIIFQIPIYTVIYIKNKWIDKIWKMAAISLAAQILTFPICIYYFHQFPNFFLLTNIIAVPLSSIILYAEIVLIIVDWIPSAGLFAGKIVTWLVWLMNKLVLWVNEIPYAVWEGIHATILSTWLLYAIVIAFGAWLINKNYKLLYGSVFCMLLFTLSGIYDNWQIQNQQKIIIYNVAQHQAIDFVSGNNYKFIGDSILLQDGVLQNFNIKPTRVALQLTQPTNTLADLSALNSFYQFHQIKILLIDHSINYEIPVQKIDVDIIVLSHGQKINMAQLAAVFNCKQYVFDASNTMWKIDKWQKDCEELHLRSYSIPEKGAFVVDVSE